MKLKRLIRDVPNLLVKGSKEIEITGICANSKLAAPGTLFVAKKGFTDDGMRYVGEAICAGAAAVLTDIYDPSLKHVTQLIHSDLCTVEGLLAANYYHFPSQELFLIGITGTNGKTTTSFLLKHLLDAKKGPAGLIGTIEYILGQSRHQATRTTPDVISNHKMLREMLNHGCRSAVMEVTSHALDQGRVNNIEFDLAIFTNLTLDHLDYHGSMENYCAAKNRLFSQLGADGKKSFPKLAIVNADSAWTDKILQGCKEGVFRYAVESPADLTASNIAYSTSGTTFKLCYLNKEVAAETTLIGRYNVYNYLAAASAGIAMGIPLEELPELLKSFTRVPGRLEPVPNNLGIKIFVDFAHSNDALANVLETLQEIKSKRIITVFGCGGDRDLSKRPKMAAAAEQYSDLCIVTSDNPRSEDPTAICQEVSSGFKDRQRHYLEPDRKKAIGMAIDLARPEDIVLIAGKGHETYQIFAHKTIEFDDSKVAAELCRAKSG